jgi:Cyclo-malto-dextrinase C-terminal domain
MNTTKEIKKVKVSRFAERMAGFTKFRDIVSKSEGTISDFNLGSYKAVAFELIK